MKTLVVLLVLSLVAAVYCQGEQAAGTAAGGTVAPEPEPADKTGGTEAPPAEPTDAKTEAAPGTGATEAKTEADATTESSAVAVSTSLALLITSLGVAMM